MSASKNKAAAASNLNGVNVDAFGKLVHNVSQDPKAGDTEWSVQTTWTTGLKTTTTIGSNTDDTATATPHPATTAAIATTENSTVRRVHSDEPLVLGGTDTAPNPGEYLLTALGQCLTVSHVAAATKRGVQLTSLSVSVTGSLALNYFLGLTSSATRAGFTPIHAVVHATAAPSVSAAVLREIHDEAVRISPIANTLRGQAPVHVQLESA
ncbi:hypothetical protein PINS_up013364 [Pythium insidiosum]|nr:hypothetical protein PINS_up013364 [Pythium insidiosum]